ncbi:hypothetical protein FRC06_000654 [Ceratobasidium sp. 370]|nr:hypothetical protein FRC06_000654 [Ceratobasidium sp. 370]
MNEFKFETYTLIVSGTPFVLSRSQIERDAPNYFTLHFLGGSGRRIHEPIQISRDPELFRLVLRYLNGYQVAPRFDGLAAPLVDLQADAEFYGLDGLLEVCKAQIETVKYAVITGYFEATPDLIAPTEAFHRIIPRFSLEIMDRDIFESASTNMRKLTKERAHVGDLLIISGWSNRIVEAVLQRYKVPASRWKVLGWNRQFNDTIRHVIIFVEFRA